MLAEFKTPGCSANKETFFPGRGLTVSILRSWCCPLGGQTIGALFAG